MDIVTGPARSAAAWHGCWHCQLSHWRVGPAGRRGSKATRACVLRSPLASEVRQAPADRSWQPR